MCQYCERRTDIAFGWNQPKLPYHSPIPGYNMVSNVIDEETWEGVIHDYQTSGPMLILTCDGYFNGTGIGHIHIPIKHCPECGRKLGKQETTNTDIVQTHYEQTIKISKTLADAINKYLHQQPSCAEECLGEDSTITKTAVFPDGIEMDIKCCGVQYREEEEDNTAWTEAVLFHNGQEVCCTDCFDEYLGTWALMHDDIEYVVTIELES